MVDWCDLHAVDVRVRFSNQPGEIEVPHKQAILIDLLLDDFVFATDIMTWARPHPREHEHAAADVVSGVFAIERIPMIPLGQILGIGVLAGLDTVGTAEIEDGSVTDDKLASDYALETHTHDAGDVITGEFDPDRIPDIPGTKIEVGTLPFDRIADGTPNYILGFDGSGVITEVDPDTLGGAVMVGADGTNDGVEGLVPTPFAGDFQRVLRGDGTWVYPGSFPVAYAELASDQANIALSLSGLTFHTLVFEINISSSYTASLDYLKLNLNADTNEHYGNNIYWAPTNQVGSLAQNTNADHLIIAHARNTVGLAYHRWTTLRMSIHNCLSTSLPKEVFVVAGLYDPAVGFNTPTITKGSWVASSGITSLDLRFLTGNVLAGTRIVGHGLAGAL